MKECDILGAKTYSDPPTYLQGVKPPIQPLYVHVPICHNRWHCTLQNVVKINIQIRWHVKTLTVISPCCDETYI